MLKQLKALFGGDAERMPRERPEAGFLRAAATLLVVAARLDGRYTTEESATIKAALVGPFALDEGQAAKLLSDAEQAAVDVTDLFSLTRALNAHLDVAGRVTIIERLWRVAYADGSVHDYEANLVRRIAGLLHVSDREAGDARKRALE